MIAPTPGRLNGTLILSGEGPRVQYSLQGIEIEFRTSDHGRDRIELSATPGGDRFVDLAPKVKTVADLSLGMLHKTRVRITTEEGVHEGLLRTIDIDYTTTSYGFGRKTHDTSIALVLGTARVGVKATDLAEVVEEESA